MDQNKSLRLVLAAALALSFTGALRAQTAPPDRVLVVNGKTAEGKVRQIDGRSYVDIEAIAQLTNGNLTIEPGRIVLTLPPSAPGPAPAVAVVPVSAPVTVVAQIPTGLSRNFASAAIAEVAEMREWRGVIGTMVNYGLAISGTWAQDYHDRADAGLRQVTLIATTDADRDALQLLTNEFNTLSGWANDVLAARQNLNGSKTVDPNALQNDPVLTRLTNCSRFLDSMLVSGDFSDDGSCH